MKKIYSFLFLCSILILSAQKELVFVYFKDKPQVSKFYNNPEIELSKKSLERRTKFQIQLNDQDAPIDENYVSTIKNLGYTIEAQSKWLNGIAIEIEPSDLEKIENLTIVAKVETFVKNKENIRNSKIDKSKKFVVQNNFQDNYGKANDQIEQINLRQLHNLGYRGKDVAIAILDTEFPTVNTDSTFKKVRDNHQILGTYNFTTKQTDVYNIVKNNHGTMVFGILAGYVDNEFVGSAPDANYYLYTTENADIEIPQEELYWIEAAEEADRMGVDIISTSLGYRDFDDSRYNYQYSDMDGETTFIARGAKIAFDKGIIVVASAGNEGMSSTYKFILSPADQADVFTIGSVDLNGEISPFSSFGPNANKHPKPDASARGTSTFFTLNNSVSSGNGTSFSAPLATGGIASLLQANPFEFPKNLLNELRKNASEYPIYNEQIGYGILNFYNVWKSLNTKENQPKIKLQIVPNPIKNNFYIKSDQDIEEIQIINSLGQQVKTFKNASQYSIEDLPAGNYYLKIKYSGDIVFKNTIKL